MILGHALVGLDARLEHFDDFILFENFVVSDFYY